MTTTDDDMQLMHGSGNMFRDLGHPNPDLEQTRAILAAKIIGVLDDEGLTARQARDQTGVAESDFSRIRRVKLERFTLDRLMTILNKLGQDVEISVKVHPHRPKAAPLQPGL